jgi:hypothetical protein
VAVNVPVVWFALPVAALWCRRNPAVGLTGAGLLLPNGMSHVAGVFTPIAYLPRTVTAALNFPVVGLGVCDPLRRWQAAEPLDQVGKRGLIELLTDNQLKPSLSE